MAGGVLMVIVAIDFLLLTIYNNIMAIVQNPITGQSSGKMSNVVFSTWKGKNVLKSKALAPLNPNTEAQQTQRNAFKKVVSWLRLLSSFYLLAYQKLAVAQSEFNVAVSRFLLVVDKATNQITTVLWSSIPLVSGNPDYPMLVSDCTYIGNNLQLTIRNSGDVPASRSLDKISVLIYNDNLEKFVFLKEVNTRPSEGATRIITYTTPEVWTGNIMIQWFFTNSLDKYLSESQAHVKAI